MPNPAIIKEMSQTHFTEPTSVLTRTNLAFYTLKNNIADPKEPVWGGKYVYSTTLVEGKREGKNNLRPDWRFHLGFGQEFFMNALHENDPIRFFCIGFTTSNTCAREKSCLTYIALNSNAESILTSSFGPTTARQIMAETKTAPIRRYLLGEVVPGSFVPRVVGTIFDTDPETRLKFFGCVSELFSPGGQLPIDYHLESKEMVFILQ